MTEGQLQFGWMVCSRRGCSEPCEPIAPVVLPRQARPGLPHADVSPRGDFQAQISQAQLLIGSTGYGAYAYASRAPRAWRRCPWRMKSSRRTAHGASSTITNPDPRSCPSFAPGFAMVRNFHQSTVAATTSETAGKDPGYHARARGRSEAHTGF